MIYLTTTKADRGGMFVAKTRVKFSHMIDSQAILSSGNVCNPLAEKGRCGFLFGDFILLVRTKKE